MGSRRNPHKHTHAAPGDNITADIPPAKGKQYGCQSQLHMRTEARGEGAGGGQGRDQEQSMQTGPAGLFLT